MGQVYVYCFRCEGLVNTTELEWHEHPLRYKPVTRRRDPSWADRDILDRVDEVLRGQP